jgi:hypothetical protein
MERHIVTATIIVFVSVVGKFVGIILFLSRAPVVKKLTCGLTPTKQLGAWRTRLRALEHLLFVARRISLNPGI